MENSKDDIAWGEAARIRARLDAPDCSAVERAQADQWRKADLANERAFRRVQAVSAQMVRASQDLRFQQMAERAFAVGAKLPEDNEQDNSQRTLRHRVVERSAAERRVIARRKYSIPASLAASAVVASFALWFSMSDPSNDSVGESAAKTGHTEFLAAPDKTPRQVTLADGSIVHIDAGARLAVALSRSERRIQLLSGRAFFEVAHDAQRPFVVTANETQTVALGTQFEVRVQGAQTEVTLLEGSVAVSGGRANNAQTLNNGELWSQRLVPGEQLRVARGVPPERYSVDASNIVSWSRGWLVFRGTPLVEAIGQINRYSNRQVTLGDASLSDLKIAGSFIAGDSDSIVNAIAEVLPIRVVDGGSREVLLFRRYDR